MSARTYPESDGRSVTVTLSSAVSRGQVAVVEGWLGIADGDGAAGDSISLSIDRREYQFTVPAALTVAKGAIVYVDVTALTGHLPTDAAYSTSTGATRQPLFKATRAKTSANIVTGILLA